MNIFRRGKTQGLGCRREAFLHLQMAHQKEAEISIMACHSSVTISNMPFFSSKAKVYMIAAGVIGGVYLLGIIFLFLGVKEKDGKIYLNLPRFSNNYFTFVSRKDCYFTYFAPLRSLCLKVRQSNTFL